MGIDPNTVATNIFVHIECDYVFERQFSLAIILDQFLSVHMRLGSHCSKKGIPTL